MEIEVLGLGPDDMIQRLNEAYTRAWGKKFMLIEAQQNLLSQRTDRLITIANITTPTGYRPVPGEHSPGG